MKKKRVTFLKVLNSPLTSSNESVFLFSFMIPVLVTFQAKSNHSEVNEEECNHRVK